MSENIIEKVNLALLDKTFKDGLSYYTQANCTCSCTDTGYRIYRTPNVNPTDNGNTMWGGLVIRPFNARDNALFKGHRYSLRFDVKGKSSNAAIDTNWNNNVGWNGGGLTPSPSDIICDNPVVANFQSDIWLPFVYEWTINDDIIKTCTSSYSSFVAGNKYISYRDFKFGFGYGATGSLGTDLYIRNIRMYDITTKQNLIKINRNGIISAGNYVENPYSKVSFKEDDDLCANEIWEV